MGRFLDILISILFLLIFLIPMIIIFLIILTNKKGSPLYWSKRIGQKNKFFLMPKFRTMIPETPEVATHLLNDPEKFYTKIGLFLRKTSLDELPQVISILKGDMSFVGPRPALYNQHDLISLRNKFGITKYKPGITGWAQIKGRDHINIEEKVKLDHEYIKKKSVFFDLYICCLTIIKVLKRDQINH